MTATTPTASTGLWGRWCAIPLYLRILAGLAVGVVTGVILGERAVALEIPAKIILQLLGALAPPLILVAVTHVLMTTEITGKTAGKLAFLLILNTTVAILIGLTVANTLKPGTWSKLEPPAKAVHEATKKSPIELIVDNVPKSILGPLGDRQNVIGVIIIAIAFGVSLRTVRTRPLTTIQDLVEIAYHVLLTMLHWIIQLVPIGVFAIVAKVIGTEGFSPLLAMGAFIIAVLVALLLQACWYLLRIKFFSWPRPLDVVRGMRDALVMAFSTDSSTATMPVTYACLKEKVGVREESASMGALVGANFNNDGTALYEAMSALFVAQLIGQHLTLWHQLLVVLTSIIASVGAAGIPEAGLVTMTLVFTAVGLPTEYIALLLTVDWFLDRCRTTINVMGDVNVACLLDGRVKPPTAEVPVPVVAIEDV
ncbi:dicarboxylate/amino acid:cation symporter [Planctomicrobium piriforme]|uniref:Na+/H+-dicarboxylate symporter n=1 Tax=Planctomicrobium piriforme TaxID=1576369 RepID=A0A1I3TJ51_9PLAN|nr:dicarboxylate/amino acid:cation symporter [Planctomicrobium piriforme]SFJ69646.1 Na+/H+-dicarboxylate symporter [Planctomicrobium piriforme]